MSTRREGPHRVGVCGSLILRAGRLIGPHSDHRPHREGLSQPHGRPLARCVAPRGDPWHRFCCYMSVQDGPDGAVAFARVATSLHALTGAAQPTAWRRAVGHTDGITMAKEHNHGEHHRQDQKGHQRHRRGGEAWRGEGQGRRRADRREGQGQNGPCRREGQGGLSRPSPSGTVARGVCATSRRQAEKPCQRGGGAGLRRGEVTQAGCLSSAAMRGSGWCAHAQEEP